jgi:hypothetical protein
VSSRSGQYPPGVTGNPNRRPKGIKNKASVEIKAFFSELLDDPDYMAAFLLAWQARTLHPSLEQMAYHYAHGKPVQSIDLGVTSAIDHTQARAARHRALTRHKLHRGAIGSPVI